MDMSLEWAEFVSWLSNWTLVVALVFGVIATYGIVVSSNIKEAALKTDLAETNERAASAGATAAMATKDAAEANLKAEEERVARLKLEAKLAPRTITQAQQNEITEKLAGLPKQVGTIYASPSLPESEWLVRILAAPLRAAGWDITPSAGTATSTYLYPGGVVIQYRSNGTNTVHESEATPSGRAAKGLADALIEMGLQATAFPVPNQVLPSTVSMEIIVTPK